MFHWTRREPRPWAKATLACRVKRLLAQRNDQQQREHPDVQHDDLDHNEGQVRQRAALAMVFQNRKEEDSFANIHHGVQQHQKGADDQGRLMCGNRRKKVGAAGHGLEKTG